MLYSLLNERAFDKALRIICYYTIELADQLPCPSFLDKQGLSVKTLSRQYIIKR